MPIEKIVTFTIGIVMSIAIVGGPQNLRANLRQTQFKILREMTRVDTWGNPSLGALKASYHHKTKKKWDDVPANFKNCWRLFWFGLCGTSGA